MRVAFLAFLLVVVPGLLMGPVQGQDVLTPEEAHLRRLGLPVQTVVDAVPRVVSLAIQEARFDGTPGQAQALVDQMRAFTADFKYGYNPIDGSQVAGVDLNAALRFAIELVDVVETIPPRIADVEVISARCGAWGDNVTGAEFEAWQERFRTGRAGSQGSLLALQARVADLPVIVDPAPLAQAVRVLEGWVGDDAVVVETCVNELEADLVRRGELDAPDQDLGVRFLRAVPSRQYVTGNVTLIGALGVHETAQTLRLHGPGIGLDRVVDLASGGRVFAVSYQVPLETELGIHPVNASLSTGAGNETEVSVDRAASRLTVRYPGRMYLGQADRMELRLESPVRGVTDSAALSVDGDLGRAVSLEAGLGSFAFQAPREEVVWQGSISYAGHRVVEPTSRVYRIDVVLAPPPREASFWELRHDVPGWVWVVPGGLLGLVLLDALIRRRRGRVGAGGQPAPAVPAVRPLTLLANALSGSRGLVWLYGAYHGFLRAVGKASPRDTVRTIEGRHGGDKGFVRRLEAMRYGGRSSRAAPGDELHVTRRWRDSISAFGFKR